MMSDLEPKAIMLRLAEDYDRLADGPAALQPRDGRAELGDKAALAPPGRRPT